MGTGFQFRVLMNLLPSLLSPTIWRHLRVNRIGIWMIGFLRNKKTGVLEQRRKPTTNSTSQPRESNPGHIGWGRVLSPPLINDHWIRPPRHQNISPLNNSSPVDFLVATWSGGEITTTYPNAKNSLPSQSTVAETSCGLPLPNSRSNPTFSQGQ